MADKQTPPASILPIYRCVWQPWCYIDDYGMPRNEMQPWTFFLVAEARNAIVRAWRAPSPVL